MVLLTACGSKDIVINFDKHKFQTIFPKSALLYWTKKKDKVPPLFQQYFAGNTASPNKQALCKTAEARGTVSMLAVHNLIQN